MSWLKRISGLILVLLAAVALTLLVYVWRSLPTLSGELNAPGLKARVIVERDSADVTHIKATSERDAAFALGYVHAQERSWQMEFNRRIMHGRLSEFLGNATLETDKLMRTLGIIPAAQRQLAGMPSEVREVLDAYASGVNTFHANSAQALPPEFHVLGIKPGVWTAADSVGWSLMMALDLGGNWGLEQARLLAAQVVDTPRLWQLFPAYPGEKPASATDLSALYRSLGVYKSTQDATKTVAARAYSTGLNGINNPEKQVFSGLWSTALTQSAQELARHWADVGNIEGKGSNNWVVAGSHTVSGKPLLANDPHLGLSAPAIWYFARLQVTGGAGSASSDVMGATLPGMPMLVLGRTAKVAWGFTNTGPDVQDLYLEQINPANPAQLKTPDGWADMTSRVETFGVKGQGSVTHTVRASRHGPIISDAQAVYEPWLNKTRFAVALRFAALDPENRTMVAGLKAHKAQSVDDLFKAYADYHSPMQNVVAADVDGNIAYKAVGKVPVRKPENDLRGVAPAPGWEAKYDWAGWLPYDQTPSDNGKKGWVSTANQRIHAADFPHFLTQDWATPERFNRIETLLAATPKHSTESFQKIHADTVSSATQVLLPFLQATVSSHALAASAQAQLKNFDANMLATSAAPLVFAAWADELARGLLIPKLGETRFKALYGKRHFRGVVEQTMRNNDAFWCAPKTCAEHSTMALDRALTRLQGLYGADVSQWQWGNAHVARSIHRPFGNVPLLARYFDVTVPTGGDPWTVNVGQYWVNEEKPYQNRHAASLRAVYDLSNLENSGFTYQTGQSGLVFSSRYRDMSQGWAAVQYRPLQMQATTVVHRQQLIP